LTWSKIGMRGVCHSAAALALLVLCACGSPGPAVFRERISDFGPERYSAWFGDERDGVIYFGLSPFWTALRQTGDPAGDMRVPSAHLIGRFDWRLERFLSPLVAREAGDDSRSSVWDVLAHPNGWVYYTTYFEEMGRVQPQTGAVERFDSLGQGLDELALARDGSIYATSYGSGVTAGKATRDGGIAVISPEGSLLRRVTLHARDGAVTAPKSLAVDPSSGEVWANADVIAADGKVSFASFHLARDLSLLEQTSAPPELLFVSFDALGRGFFVWDRGGRLELEVTRAGEQLARLDLGPRAPADFAQDIHVAADGAVAIAFWSGRVELVRESAGHFASVRTDLSFPADCTGGSDPALLYSAFATPRAIFATLYCDATVLRAPLPR
jgi:hypothetical protein